MPSPKNYCDAHEPSEFLGSQAKAILAKRTMISMTPLVAAYMHPQSDVPVDQLTKMVKDLQTKLDVKSSQEGNQPQQPQRRQHGAENNTGGDPSTNGTSIRIQPGTSRDKSSTRNRRNNDAQDEGLSPFHLVFGKEMSHVMRKPTFWFPTWSDTNRAV